MEYIWAQTCHCNHAVLFAKTFQDLLKNGRKHFTRSKDALYALIESYPTAILHLLVRDYIVLQVYYFDEWETGHKL